MGRTSGLIVSEMVTIVIMAAVTLAVGFGFYVSHERDAMVESAEVSLAAVSEAVAKANGSGQPINCDNSLVDPGVLDNNYLSLSILPTRLDELDRTKGYVPGIQIHSNKEADGNDTFVTAMRLYDAIVEGNDISIRAVKKELDEKGKVEDIQYSMLASTTALCKPAEEQ